MGTGLTKGVWGMPRSLLEPDWVVLWLNRVCASDITMDSPLGKRMLVHTALATEEHWIREISDHI